MEQLTLSIGTLIIFHEKIIRSMSCMVFLPGSDDLVHKRTVCEFCFKTEHYLCTKKSRYYQKSQDEKNDESTVKLKPGQTFAVMSKEELLKITRQQSSELKALHKRVKRLEECRKKMSDVGEKTYADFRFIFERLEKGMREKKEKLKNPVCLWSGCTRKSFQDVKCLYSHVKEHVPETEANTSPVDRVYVCMWKNCSKKFSKKGLLYNHVHDHTGGMQDQFFEVLLKDQAKALTTPSRQMRWHLLVIKWCLGVYSKSHALYDIRDSGFLKLPIGRTLSDYKNFCSSSSGWKTDRIMLMKEN